MVGNLNVLFANNQFTEVFGDLAAVVKSAGAKLGLKGSIAQPKNPRGRNFGALLQRQEHEASGSWFAAS